MVISELTVKARPGGAMLVCINIAPEIHLG